MGMMRSLFSHGRSGLRSSKWPPPSTAQGDDSLPHTRSSLEDNMEHMFGMFNANVDGRISRVELAALFKRKARPAAAAAGRLLTLV